MATFRRIGPWILSLLVVWAALAQIWPRAFMIDADRGALLKVLAFALNAATALAPALIIMWLLTMWFSLENRLEEVRKAGNARIEAVRIETAKSLAEVEARAQDNVNGTAISIRERLEPRIETLEQQMKNTVRRG